MAQTSLGKGVNIRLLLFTMALALAVVGPMTLKTLSSRPDFKVTKRKITRAELVAFKTRVKRMVEQYTVRREEGVPVVHPPAGGDVYLLARNYDWGHFILELERGKTYRLHLTSQDLRHAIVVRELKLMNRIKPGEAKVIEFAPLRAGRFQLICGEFCGPGHARMIGTLIVTEPR